MPSADHFEPAGFPDAADASTIPASGAAAVLSPADLQTLREARARLEHPGLTVKLASTMGAPIEKLLARLPSMAGNLVNDATRAALDKCLALALRTLSKTAPEPGRLQRHSGRLHKLAVAATGAAGGAFGFVSLPVELPVTTTLMFRSIGEIAREYGEDLASPEAQLQCLMVLAMGGPSKQDDDATYGYFVVRGAMAQTVASATAELAGKGAASHSSAFVAKMLHSVAARFSAQVGEQAAAKAVPVIGAVFGAAINTIFIEHFQQMAKGHFAVRQLERRYGEAAVRQAYERVGG